MTSRTLDDLEAERIGGTSDEREVWLAQFRLVLALIAEVMHEDDRRSSARTTAANKARGGLPPRRH